MNLKITGLHMEVTEAIKTYVTEKMERISRHHDGVISTTVTLSVEKLQQKAAVQVHLAGKDLHVETSDADMYAAIDALVDKLDRAIKQHKEKQQH
ncbi:ribosome hibernation-promoting factor, HPF/YfiA family [Wielerella bovis]|uniref:ribosome hibernation-promoting factor, HPF/YfiA family n=1 Tax=Wielerella bovis TaxID=2917790 RepID=UPI002019C1BB|nr:ribosome-associated translation inhibitor RaiA [Wielerella bovis]ULJ59800.1 ribosome-associated translation inhibitor RaiA [Wielerella bovis]ULJ62004.1 ribosome-associated translation inhibitor RaiA [Wielerella bovis]ULJ64229.1 ribosome-associated translation inhibitor RaiA [Wielerella bovis]ULJ67852.1 ribosome-associated translation inhibitor RaiA [Wielerella bovis]ULJ68767.1 ribosome-associated translation inhibitor RaiA [Wielerella bovis]